MAPRVLKLLGGTRKLPRCFECCFLRLPQTTKTRGRLENTIPENSIQRLTTRTSSRPTSCTAGLPACPCSEGVRGALPGETRIAINRIAINRIAINRIAIHRIAINIITINIIAINILARAASVGDATAPRQFRDEFGAMLRQRKCFSRGVPSTACAFRDFKDTVFHSSNQIPFPRMFYCVVFSCSAILRIEECLNSTL